MNSSCCCIAGKPGFDGQSILDTVAIHAALNSLLGVCAKLMVDNSKKRMKRRGKCIPAKIITHAKPSTDIIKFEADKYEIKKSGGLRVKC